MSHCKVSTGRSAYLRAYGGSALPSRLIRMVVTLALLFCVFATTNGEQMNQKTCGKRLISNMHLIHHGTESMPGHWPWHVAVFHWESNQFTYKCGGSIVDKNTILTAAHCVTLNVQNILVHAGHVELDKMKSQQGYNVSAVIVHPRYNQVEHDIALLMLSTNIVMDQFVQPICLLDMSDDNGQIIKKPGTVVGFGLNEQDKTSSYLQEATLTVVDGYTCLENDGGYRAVLTSNMYCAGGQNGTSPCNGDSGSGMFFEKGDKWYIGGIVSTIAMRPNSYFCDPHKYTIFTYVSKYAMWIHSIQTRWALNHLEPCKDGSITRENITCNVANRYEHDFLLIARDRLIIRVPFNGGQSSSVGTELVKSGIDHDCAEGRFYWSNLATDQIFSAKYDGTDRRPFITGNIGWASHVAVDWISRRLYWTDRIKGVIEVASLENPDVRSVLISEHVSTVWAIAVDPLQGKLYWSNNVNGREMIEWSNLDGTERQVLVSFPRVRSIRALQVSIATGELCYVDSGTERVECIEPYDQRNRTIAINLSNAWALAVTDELFYMTEWNRPEINIIDQHGVRQKPITSRGFDFVNSLGMTAVTNKCPLFYSPCGINNGGCPVNTICLVNPSAPAGKSCIVKK